VWWWRWVSNSTT